MAFTDPIRGWIVGSSGRILCTTNGGLMWTKQFSPTTKDLRGLSFQDSTRLWAAGPGGTILQYGTLATFTSSLAPVVESRIAIRNYPNPFNPTTRIQFELPAANAVTLKVYDLLGQEVATLMEGAPLTEGKHDVVFDGQGLSSGVYLYRIFTTDKKAESTGKMLLLK
ncbi:MAG: T9SS type A sorting domain-containing protein [Ignavibacteriales bacterium]|nr:T9SS type A sorting domain-containing protein [Ignavibacteriales bacterium]